MKNIVVVGSGYGGVTAAALLQKEGCRVTLLEAAGELGGCAGKFQRRNYRFPVGATLAMGLNSKSIHGRINHLLGIEVEAFRLDRVMEVEINEKLYTYYSDRKKFLQMWQNNLPSSSDKITAFFKNIWSLSQTVRKHMETFPVLPPRSILEAGAVLRGLSSGSIRLVPALNKTLKYYINKHQLSQEKEFIQFLDSVLMDSMQTTSGKCSALMGAAALDVYHGDAWYIYGGHYKMIEKMVESLRAGGGTVLKPRRVVKVQSEGKKWKVEDHRGTLHEADEVILNVPLANALELLESNEYKGLSSRLKKAAEEREQWGAYSVYYAFKNDLEKEIPLFKMFAVPGLSEESHFFASTSAPGDLLRAPEGYRTLTVSTHIDLKNWRTKEEYDIRAARMKKVIRETIEKSYAGFTAGLIYEIDGGPKAWEKYTGRKDGGVGGFPQTSDYALTKAVSHRSGLKGLWLCGDNVFPGAGSIGAASSGVHAARSILKKRIL